MRGGGGGEKEKVKKSKRREHQWIELKESFPTHSFSFLISSFLLVFSSVKVMGHGGIRGVMSHQVTTRGEGESVRGEERKHAGKVRDMSLHLWELIELFFLSFLPLSSSSKAVSIRVVRVVGGGTKVMGREGESEGICTSYSALDSIFQGLSNAHLFVWVVSFSPHLTL